MNAIKSASVVVCACCIVCSIIGLISPSGTMKKTVNLILGAFLICSMIIPLVGLSSALMTDFSVSDDFNVDTYPYNNDENYEQLILNETAENLVTAANDLLVGEGITAENIEISIKKSENNSIYISAINIYITKEDEYKAEKIKNIITRNMSKEPVIIVND